MDTLVFLFFLATTTLTVGALFHTSLEAPTRLKEEAPQAPDTGFASWHFGSEGIMTVLALSICAAILSL